MFHRRFTSDLRIYSKYNIKRQNEQISNSKVRRTPLAYLDYLFGDNNDIRKIPVGDWRIIQRAGSILITRNILRKELELKEDYTGETESCKATGAEINDKRR